MCGILGIAGVNPMQDSSWFTSGLETMIHRGPDDSGVWSSGDHRVYLGHRRLSIFDLSPLGHQPMHFAERGISIVFNGEIYNFIELKKDLEKSGYKFISRTDTEVLLAGYAEWGYKMLPRLNGAFSFAIYDQVKQKIFMARDRAGEKPLFYCLSHQRIYFASELKALLKCPDLTRIIDNNSLDNFLELGFVPGEKCILSGYKKLPAAHALEFDINENKLKTWQYWELPDSNVEIELSDEKVLLEQLESLLEDAVARQTLADVPVGILLSGGLDSSLITAMAARSLKKVSTFTVTFKGNKKFDESAHASLISEYFCTNHTQLEVDPSSIELLPKLAQQFDEPIADSSLIPTYLVSNLVKQYCTVALGGDGGDELFGGYHQYTRLLWLQRWIGRLPYDFRKILGKTASTYIPQGVKGRNYLTAIGTDFQKGLSNFGLLFDTKSRRMILPELYSSQEQKKYDLYESLIPVEADLLTRALKMDFKNFLAEDILVKVDRASMLSALEVRAPMLDFRLIEFAFEKIPSHLKATAGAKKILLKKLGQKILPSGFKLNRKQGFSLPLSDWLKTGPYKELFHDVLLSSDCFFEHSFILKLLERHKNGHRNSDRLFALIVFELWRKSFAINSNKNLI